MPQKREEDFLTLANRRALIVAALMAAVLLGGTIGYRIISEGRSTIVDCLYMTVITVTTIGYGETVDLSGSPGGRIFTMFVALSGIGIITYALTSFTAMAVDGELQARWRRRRMLKSIREMSGHYVLCGWSGIAREVVRELGATGRPVVVIAPKASLVQEESGVDRVCLLEGDVTSDELLEEAGIARAAGVFAATDDDHTNIIVCLSAHRLNGQARIVSACRLPENAVKMRKAGAHSTVSVVAIGGLRMASEMVRPAVVSFLDTMLRARGESPLRVEEIPVPASLVGQPLAAIDFSPLPRTLLLAVRRGDDWVFKPPADRSLASGDVLIVMTSPEEREALARRLAPA